MDHKTTEEIRRRAWHYTDATTAAVSGMSVWAIRQFAIGAYAPTDEQLTALARRFSIPCRQDATGRIRWL